MTEFIHWPKIPRATNLRCYITEKIDGTNAQICIGTQAIDHDSTEMPEDVVAIRALAMTGITFKVGSRNRWITPEADNYGFARWAYENKEMLLRLGEGRHYGEWWGQGIQRGYGLSEKRFTLFDRRRWDPEKLSERGLDGLVSVVPMLATCDILDLGPTMLHVERQLVTEGSVAAPGWMRPEGVVVNIGNAVSFKITDLPPGGKLKGVTAIGPVGPGGNKFRQEADALPVTWDPVGGRPINPDVLGAATGGLIPSQETIGRVQMDPFTRMSQHALSVDPS